MRAVCLILFVFSIRVSKSDDYLNENQERCYRSKKLYSCAKFRFLKYVNNYNLNSVNTTISNSFVKLLPFSNPYNNESGIFQESRQFPEDNEMMKFFKFVQRQADLFLNSRGVAFSLPNGARVLEEDDDTLVVEERGPKKKKELFIPLIMLFKLFKIKVLVALTLAGVLFIKKTILVAALVLPSVIASLKQHCKQQQYHVVPYHVDEGHYHHDSHEHAEAGTGYGYSGYGSGKDWERSKVKRFSYP